LPLYSKEQIKDGIVALWEINEDFDELLNLVPAAWINTIDIQHISKHNLAARALANEVCPGFKLLEKDKYGKPYFESKQHEISITHAGKYAGFMLHKTSNCGIDMERITERIRPLQSKFIREDEQGFLKWDLKGMFMVWCAKEAMYKYYGRKALDFKTHLKVYVDSISESGTIKGEINKGDYQKELDLQYKFIDDYLIVHTI
jgi:4'-phosphopantetheinyl transferase